MMYMFQIGDKPLVNCESHSAARSYIQAFQGHAMLGIWIREVIQEALRGAG